VQLMIMHEKSGGGVLIASSMCNACKVCDAPFTLIPIDKTFGDSFSTSTFWRSQCGSGPRACWYCR
jgi:hypothetical protein